MNPRTYRAAVFRTSDTDVGVAMTGPEHAHLSDEALRAQARSAALRAHLIDTLETDPQKAFPRLTWARFEAGLSIDDWTEG